jgi:hypothetical protein
MMAKLQLCITNIKSKSTTKILTLVSIIEKHDSGQKRDSGCVFRPELVNCTNLVVIFKSQDKRDSLEDW